jgi:hypothetical protein
VNGCLAFASGEARADDGVAELVFLGIRLGDGCASLGSSGNFVGTSAEALFDSEGALAVAAAYDKVVNGFGISS